MIAQTKTAAGITVVRARESALRAMESEELRRVISEHRRDGMSVVLDLSNVKYCDCSGLGVIVWGLQAFRREHSVFAVCGIGGQMWDLLEELRILPLLDHYASEEEALQTIILPNEPDRDI